MIEELEERVKELEEKSAELEDLSALADRVLKRRESLICPCI